MPDRLLSYIRLRTQSYLKKFPPLAKVGWWWLLLVLGTTAQAQLVDNFSDGDFTQNPPWTGDTSQFIVNVAGQLQLQADAGGTRYLATANALRDSTEWNAYVRMDFSPSNNNYARLYLVSDQADLTGSLQGYYLRMGENLALDGIDLYRQDGTESTLLLKTFAGAAAVSPRLRIRVTRSATGQWAIFADPLGGNALLMGGEVTDNVHTATSFFGVWCQFTASNATRFYFDDFEIKLIEPDTVPPVVLQAEPLTESTLRLVFSEPVDSVSASDPEHYFVNQGLGLPVAATWQRTAPAEVVLTFDGNFLPNQPYDLTAALVADLSGNVMAVQTIGFTFLVPYVPGFRELVINELMADENPPVGLPLAEFVELFNPTAQPIELGGMTLADLSTTATLGNYLLPAGGYLILCRPAQVAEFLPYGPVMGLSLPTLNNTSETLTLRRADGTLLDQISYDLSWYGDPDKQDGGWTLEQINPLAPCSDARNWRASTDETGGTPGRQNAVFALTVDTLPPTLVGVTIPTPDTLLLIFDQPLDSLSAVTASYFLSPTLPFGQPLPAGPDFARVRLPLSQPLSVGVAYTLTVTNVRDCAGNLRDSTSVIFGEGRMPGPYEVLITELMADPTPPVGLPEQEFVELYNTTSDLLELGGSTFAHEQSIATLPSLALRPDEYVILCRTSAVAAWSPYGRAVGVTSFPALRNAGAALVLRNAAGDYLHGVRYADTWYDDAEKRDGGWTLEMRDVQIPCADRRNWTASTDPSGGTPGRANAVAAPLPTMPPRLREVAAVGGDTLLVTFDATLEADAVVATAFALDGGLVVVTATVAPAPDRQVVRLLLSTPPVAGRFYTLRTAGLRDCQGQPLPPDSLTFGVGRPPGRFELLITEIMANPSPVVGLPEREYLEVFNASADLLELRDVALSDATSTTRLPALALRPGEHVVLCGTSAVPALAPLARTLGVTSFPSLTIGGKRLTLRNPVGELLHTVDYRDTWYGDPAKRNGGWSLEMVDVGRPCGGRDNWTASTDPRGGTPGAPNAAQAQNPDLTPPQLLRADVADAQTLHLRFDEPLDSLATTTDAYATLQPDGLSGQLRVMADLQAEVVVRLSAPLRPRTVYTLTLGRIADCTGNRSPEGRVTLALPEVPVPGDVLLNEVLFHPPVGGVDFVELVNVSDKYVDLRGFRLANVRGDTVSSPQPITAEPYVLAPGQYVALTTDAARLAADYPRTAAENVLVMAALPAYNADEGTVILLDPDGQMVQQFDYSAEMHFPLLTERRGVSLERVGFDRPVNEPDSWHSAASEVGYATPGYLNSQARPAGLLGEQWRISPEVITPDGDGDRDFAEIFYQFDTPGYVANLTLYDAAGRQVRQLVRNALLGTAGIFKWDGTWEDGRKARVGPYLLHAEVFDLQGNVHQIEKKIIVGTRF